jgi:polyhydroxyalkanoate synthesis regulator phasin
MDLNLQIALLNELNDFLNEIGGDNRKSNPIRTIKKSLEKDFDLNKDEINHIISQLKRRIKGKDGQLTDAQAEKLESFLGLLKIRPRQFDPKNPDIKKLKTNIANKKVKLKKSLS